MRHLSRHCVAAATLLFTGMVEASAHAFPRPYDLPLPLGHWLISAGAAVVLSFLAAVRLMHQPGPTPERALAFPRQATDAFLIALQCVSVAILALLVAAGLFGEQGDWDSNILPVAVWVAWWVGMAFACALVGDVWALVNPWAATGRQARRLRGKSRPPRLVA